MDRDSDHLGHHGGAIVRRGRPQDVPAILSCVEAVVSEVYGHLFVSGRPPSPDPSEPWADAWVLDDGGAIFGVGLAIGDRIDDLWIAETHRGGAFGTALLRCLEGQIGHSGHRIARLRVVTSNDRARLFYRRQGWTEGGSYAHDVWGFGMTDLSKPIAPT